VLNASPVSQSVGRSVCQSLSQPVTHSLTQFTHSLTQSLSHSVTQSLSQSPSVSSVSQSDSQSDRQMCVQRKSSPYVSCMQHGMIMPCTRATRCDYIVLHHCDRLHQPNKPRQLVPSRPQLSLWYSTHKLLPMLTPHCECYKRRAPMPHRLHGCVFPAYNRATHIAQAADSRNQRRCVICAGCAQQLAVAVLPRMQR